MYTDAGLSIQRPWLVLDPRVGSRDDDDGLKTNE
jgi:hypothetical protein